MTITDKKVFSGGIDAKIGRVVRVTGPVVDVEFPRHGVAALCNALRVKVILGRHRDHH